MMDKRFERARAWALCMLFGCFVGVFSTREIPAQKPKPIEPMSIDRDRGEIRLAGVVQRNDRRPAHGKWGKKSTAFVGVRGGDVERDFVIVLAAAREKIYSAAKGLGWKTGRRFTWDETKSRRGLSAKTLPEHYMTGDPVLCILEFEKNGRKVRMPLEDAIRSRVKIDRKWVEKPFTPHFVFTGAGEENGIESGCLYCPSDCVGGLFTDNSGPVQTELLEFLVDWKRLPPPGTAITVIVRSIR